MIERGIRMCDRAARRRTNPRAGAALLPRVAKRCFEDTVNCVIDVSRFSHYHRILASKLRGERHEVLGRGDPDQAVIAFIISRTA